MHLSKEQTNKTLKCFIQLHIILFAFSSITHCYRPSHGRYWWAGWEMIIQNSFLCCLQLKAPYTGLWRGDPQERMCRCFGLFLSTAFMTHRTPSPIGGLLASPTVCLLLSTIRTHSSWCPLSSPVSSDLLSQQSPEELLLWYFFSLDQVLPLSSTL